MKLNSFFGAENSALPFIEILSKRFRFFHMFLLFFFLLEICLRFLYGSVGLVGFIFFFTVHLDFFFSDVHSDFVSVV